MKKSHLKILFIIGIVFNVLAKPQQYYIKGRLINDCDNSPVADIRIDLTQRGAGGILTPYKKGVNVYTTSEYNGDFEILYKVNHKSDLSLLTMESQIPAENLDLGNIPYYSTATVYYKIKINNPYSNTDTLFIFDITSNNNYYKMLGPFHDTIIGIKTIKYPNELKYNPELKIVEKISFEIGL
jgi:hypothetical protein